MTSSNSKSNYTDNSAYYIPTILISTITVVGTLSHYIYKKQITDKSNENISNEVPKTSNPKYKTNVIINENFDVYMSKQNKINIDIYKKYDNYGILFNSFDKAINQVVNDNKILKEKILNNDKAVEKNTLELQILKEKILNNDKAVEKNTSELQILKEKILNNDKVVKKNTLELQILKEKILNNDKVVKENPEYYFFNGVDINA